MTRYGRLALLGGVVALALAGCSTTGTPTPTGSASASGQLTFRTVITPTTPVPPPVSEPAPGAEYKETYGFAVPSSPVTIQHTVTPPIAGPNDPPLPYLVGIYVGDHPEGSPKYQRISFYFRGAFPGYRFSYVASVLSQAQGTPVALPGNAKLSVVFLSAQAHDNAGATTLLARPDNPIGYHNLKGYASAGDFEGSVAYGLGIQTAANSDQALPIRTGELKKPDGAGGFYYVVHFDVQTG